MTNFWCYFFHLNLSVIIYLKLSIHYHSLLFYLKLSIHYVDTWIVKKAIYIEEFIEISCPYIVYILITYWIYNKIKSWKNNELKCEDHLPNFDLIKFLYPCFYIIIIIFHYYITFFVFHHLFFNFIVSPWVLDMWF